MSRLIKSANPNKSFGYVPNEFLDDCFLFNHYHLDAYVLGCYLFNNLDCGRGEIVTTLNELKERLPTLRSPINSLKRLVKLGHFTVTELDGKNIGIRYTKPAPADYVPPAAPALKIFEETV